MSKWALGLPSAFLRRSSEWITSIHRVQSLDLSTQYGLHAPGLHETRCLERCRLVYGLTQGQPKPSSHCKVSKCRSLKPLFKVDGLSWIGVCKKPYMIVARLRLAYIHLECVHRDTAGRTYGRNKGIFITAQAFRNLATSMASYGKLLQS